MSQEMVTLLVVEEPTEQALVEGALREAGVRYALRNEGVQNLVGGGRIGGFNPAAGPIEIQVASSDLLRANTALQEARGQEGLALAAETEPAGEVERRALAVRYARYSAVWAFLAVWGVGSLLGIWFGIQSLRRSRGALTLTKGLAVFGIGLGLLGLAVLGAAVWQLGHLPASPIAYIP